MGFCRILVSEKFFERGLGKRENMRYTLREFAWDGAIWVERDC